MRTKSVLLSLYGSCALMSLPALAQSAPGAVESVHSGAPVPQLEYQSAFENYRPYREQPLASWRDLNEEVARVGGHAGMFAGGHHAGSKPEKSAPANSAREPAGQSPLHMGH